MEDLDAASLEDVSAFFRTYYAPNNAVLSVVGDVEPAAVRALGRALLRRASRPTRRSRRCGDLSLPPTLGGERREIVPDRVPLPRIYVGFRAPAFGDPRLDALDVAGQILAGGKGSRLHRRLVREERIAQDVALFTLGLRRRRVDLRPAGRPPGPGVAIERRRNGVPRGARADRSRAGHRRRAGAGARAHRGRRARRAPAGRGAGRPAVDVRDAVRRPGPDQPDAAALPGGHAGAIRDGRGATSSAPTTGWC